MKTFFKIIGSIFLLLVLAVAGIAATLRSNIPESSLALAPMSDQRLTSDENSVLIFGATRNTGLIVAQKLIARGDNVTAFVRPTSDTAELEKLGVDLVVGDAMDLDTVRAAYAAGNYAAVVTTIGCLSCEPPPDYQGNAHVIQAAAEAGAERLLLVTTIGSGDSFDAMNWLSKFALSKTLPLKTRAEDDLRASGLKYTIIRPGGLSNKPGTGNGILSEDRSAFGFIFRQDLAELIIAALDDDQTIGKTFAAIDANRQRPWGDG